MGEALIDFLPIEERGRTVGFYMHPAGSMLNVAIACTRLGQPVALATKVANDYFGRLLTSYAASEGIDTRFLVNTDSLSTLAFVSHEKGEPIYTFYGENTADTLLTTEELSPNLFLDTSILHFGSISLMRGSTPGTILETAERLKGNKLLSLDPNLRPNLVRNEIDYRKILDHAFALADIVKISAADLNWLMPNTSIPEAALKLIATGPALVVVTKGGEGVYAVRSNEETPLSLPTFPVNVIDTVGAGDSFNGGMLTSLAEANVLSRTALESLDSSDLISVLRFAAAVAALNCTQQGANPPSRSQVEALLSSTSYD